MDFIHLPTTKIFYLYKLQWLSKCGELKVYRKVVIRFKVGNYQDEVLCDMVPMQVYHLLFDECDSMIVLLIIMVTPISISLPMEGISIFFIL